MLRVYGIAVTPEDTRHLVASLIAEGSPDAISTAGKLTRGVYRELYAVALSPPERDAMLSVLEDPPEELAELRSHLLRDYVVRSRPMHLGLTFLLTSDRKGKSRGGPDAAGTA